MRDGKGGLMINEEEASVVKMIFDLYLQGHGSSYIQNELSKKKIRSPHGGNVWPRNTIEKLLRNEKYTGDVIVYKTFTADFPSRKRIVNNELRSKFMNKGHHEPIISQKVFDKVQDEIARRSRKTK